MEKIRIGLIGCGAIGTDLAEAVDRGVAPNAELTAVFDIYPEKMKELSARLRHRPREYVKFEEFLKADTDLVIEAASQEAVRLYAERVLNSGRDLMMMSVGALLEEPLLKRIEEAAERVGRRVFIPSGALGGIDAVRAARLGGIRSVTLTTRKHPDSLKYSPYYKSRLGDKAELKEPQVIFEGSAEEAVKAFPASVNVSATLSLAGIGGSRTKVRIVADPAVSENIHEVEVEGGFGRMKIVMENVRHSSNPRTSYLAILSAVETLKAISSVRVKVGT